MAILQELSRQLASKFDVKPTRIFAKILTPNDDAGRHGVLIPNEAYGFFPELPIPDQTQNSTVLIPGLDVASRRAKPLGWKYYERYPERRITRLNNDLNNTDLGRRLVIFIKATTASGNEIHLIDIRLEERDSDFNQLQAALFNGAQTAPGSFVQLAIDAPEFRQDQYLSELLEHYDEINSRGWIDSLRVGDTGIGYTFETLVGIKENNDQSADYKGIEIKCSLKKEKKPNAGKINLFQMGPSWSKKAKMIDRLREIGTLGNDGLYSCYSQVTPYPNNLGLNLVSSSLSDDIELRKYEEELGVWEKANLARRLAMKHSRAVFIKADSRVGHAALQYHYNELIYCEQPDIERFIDMVSNRRIVFEFAMYESTSGRVRNHGYPWRLVNARELDTLFGYQIKLRG